MNIFSLLQEGDFSKFEEFLRNLSSEERSGVIDARDENGFTPIHFAAAKESEDFLKLLLEMKANPNALSYNTEEYISSTPIQEAVDANLYPNVLLLLKHHADPNTKNGEGKPTLILAIEAGQHKIAELLAFYSDLSLTDEAGSTSLHWSASKGFLKLTLQLLSIGADPNIKNALFPPIIEAALKGHVDICKALKNAGAHMPEELVFDKLKEEGILGANHIIEIKKIISDVEEKLANEEPKNSSSIVYALDLALSKNRKHFPQCAENHALELSVSVPATVRQKHVRN